MYIHLIIHFSGGLIIIYLTTAAIVKEVDNFFDIFSAAAAAI